MSRCSRDQETSSCSLAVLMEQEDVCDCFTFDDPTASLPEQVCIHMHATGIEITAKAQPLQCLQRWDWSSIKYWQLDEGAADDFNLLRIVTATEDTVLSFIFECESTDMLVRKLEIHHDGDMEGLIEDEEQKVILFGHNSDDSTEGSESDRAKEVHCFGAREFSRNSQVALLRRRWKLPTRSQKRSRNSLL